jgi:hypothetical protein
VGRCKGDPMRGGLHPVAGRRVWNPGNPCARGVTRCRDWAETLHMPAEPIDEVRWLHGAGGWGQ